MRVGHRLFQITLTGSFLVSRLIGISLLWLIASVPLITIPPALIALYVTIQALPNQEERLFVLFFRAGRNLFWRSYGFITPVIVILAGLYEELRFYISQSSPNGITVIMTGMVIGFLLIFLGYVAYLLPVTSRTNLSFWDYPLLLLTRFRSQMFITVSLVILLWVCGFITIILMPGMLVLGVVPMLLLATHYLTNADFELRFQPFITQITHEG